MKKLFTAAIFALAICSFAEPPSYNFRFTDGEAQTIFKALTKLPYEESADIIAKIRRQANDTTLNPIKK